MDANGVSDATVVAAIARLARQFEKVTKIKPGFSKQKNCNKHRQYSTDNYRNNHCKIIPPTSSPTSKNSVWAPKNKTGSRPQMIHDFRFVAAIARLAKQFQKITKIQPRFSTKKLKQYSTDNYRNNHCKIIPPPAVPATLPAAVPATLPATLPAASGWPETEHLNPRRRHGNLPTRGRAREARAPR